MIVVTRRVGQEIKIQTPSGEVVTVKLLRIKTQTRVGVDAPTGSSIWCPEKHPGPQPCNRANSKSAQPAAVE